MDEAIKEIVKLKTDSYRFEEKNPNNKSRRRDLRVSLWREGEERTWLVSRLVALTHLHETFREGLTVNHIDGNHRNNHVSNLEWVSYTDNNNHAFDNRLIKTGTPVKIIGPYHKEMEFRSVARGARFLERSHDYVSRRLKGSDKALYAKDGTLYHLVQN